MNKGLKYEHLAHEWKELYESGVSIREIGRRYDVDNKTVNRTLSPHIEKRRIDKWFEYSDEWYDLYVNQGYTRTDIAKKYKTTVAQVSKVLKKMGVPPERSRKRKYEHLLKTWIEEYQSGDSLETIALRHGVGSQTVLNYLNDEGIEARTKSEARRILPLDDHYFDELNEEKAYHLGLIYSTGTSLLLHNSYAIEMSVGEARRYLLNPLLNVLRGEVEGVYLGADGVYRFRIASKYMYEHLKSLGFSTKTESKFPEIEKELIPSFIYGYLEGASKIQPSSGYLYIDGWILFLKRLKEELQKLIDSKDVVLKKRKAKEQYRIEINNRDKVIALKRWFLMNINFDTFEHTAEKTWLFERSI